MGAGQSQSHDPSRTPASNSSTNAQEVENEYLQRGSFSMSKLGSIMQPLSQKEQQVIQEASQTLCVAHCQREAMTLMECMNKKGRSVPEQQCMSELQAMRACADRAQESGDIQRDLVKIGMIECREDFNALVECKKRGGECDAEERRLVLCSAEALLLAMKRRGAQ